MATLHGKAPKKNRPEGLNITSMMDMFTIILVFLLRSYSADGSIMTNADNLVLPNSTSRKKPQEVNLQVAITRDMILVDNQPVCPTSDAGRIPQTMNDPIVPELQQRLSAAYAQEEEMVRMGALNEVMGKVVVQVDKNIDFDVIYKVMNTCGKVGYNRMNFAVMERDG